MEDVTLTVTFLFNRSTQYNGPHNRAEWRRELLFVRLYTLGMPRSVCRMLRWILASPARVLGDRVHIAGETSPWNQSRSAWSTSAMST